MHESDERHFFSSNIKMRNKMRIKCWGSENEGLLFLQFSRSCVGGSTVLPFPTEVPEDSTTCTADTKDATNENDIFLVTEASRPKEDSTDLRFESRFESGNLGKVVKITDTYYQLYLRRDLYTQRHTQWYYFKVSNTRSRITYRYN